MGMEPQRSEGKEMAGRFPEDWEVGMLCDRVARRGIIGKGTPALFEFCEVWKSDG